MFDFLGSIIEQSKRSKKHIDELKFQQIINFSSCKFTYAV